MNPADAEDGEAARALGCGEVLAFACEGLTVRASAAAEGPILDAFFAGYDQAFVLPNEKEGLDGFRECLDLNFGPEHARLSARYGTFRELVLIVEDAGTLVGGANFICHPLPEEDARPALGANLNYAYVTPAHRRRGRLQTLLHAVEAAIRRIYPSAGAAPPLLTFLEMNDPVKMAASAYAEDSGHSGLDQLQRIGIWAKLGARIVDFDYVQPPLSHEQAADRDLLYAVIGAPRPMLSACLLKGHLERFFGISVLKGRAPHDDATARRQLDELAPRCLDKGELALLDASGLLASRPRISDLRGSARTFRDLLREHAARADRE